MAGAPEPTEAAETAFAETDSLARTDGPAPDAAVDEARRIAKARIAAEVAERAGQDRMKARRAKVGKYLVGGMFVVMLFERAVNGGWFN